MALCVLLSLLLHAALAWALDLLPRGQADKHHPSAARAVRHVHVQRAKPGVKKTAATPQQEPQPPFVKTSADEREHRTQTPDFIGKHNSVASGEENAPRRSSDAHLPSMTGRESEEEIVTFDQERQDGELELEGKRQQIPETPPAALAQGRPDGTPEQTERDEEGHETPPQTAPATAARQEARPAAGEGLRLSELHTQDALTIIPQQPEPAPLGVPEGNSRHNNRGSRLARATVYDPALSAEAQPPGLRTYERRTRSTGRFVFGKRPALNVAATVRGRYEAEIYRRIARMWYAACDDHRGDIIPGSITISLRLTKSGSIDSMELMRRRGASVIQQSFSFGAIRRASLPPMPPAVQQEVIGRLYEIILTFNFD